MTFRRGKVKTSVTISYGGSPLSPAVQITGSASVSELTSTMSVIVTPNPKLSTQIGISSAFIAEVIPGSGTLSVTIGSSSASATLNSVTFDVTILE